MTTAPEPFANVNGFRLSTGAVTIPWYGLWSAAVEMALEDPLPASVTLTVGNLSLVGAVVRQAAYSGNRSALLVGGAGGWRRTIPRVAYLQPGGLRLSTVLRDAAGAVGETVSIATDRTIGQSFARATGPASRVLRLLAGSTWFVDAAGVTQVRDRPYQQVQSVFTVATRAPAPGLVEIATEDLAAWLPGAWFTAPTVPEALLVASITHRFDNAGKLRTQAMTAPLPASVSTTASSTISQRGGAARAA